MLNSEKSYTSVKLQEYGVCEQLTYFAIRTGALNF